MYIVFFYLNLLGESAQNQRIYYVRKRPDRFGSWYTTEISEAKTWRRILNAHNWIDSRDNFRNRYNAQVGQLP